MKKQIFTEEKRRFPYSYFSNPEILNETCLPPKAAFFNNLSSTPVKDEDYDFALLVFRTFKCKKFADYLQLYQQLDVILLAEVFTSFRQKCLQFYKLDPCHFITAADLTWNAGLKYTKVELELFSDINMYLWIENSIRGGICFVGKRYALANNPFIPGFNKHEEESYIIAVDANNLYGYAMSQPLPIGHFFWLTKDEKIPEGSELANMVVNDAQMVAKVAKLAANLVSKNDANLALPPRFRQVLIELPL
ncbi:uncharacterized protein TNCV_1556761 [Trichonephila clavipes]|nr:uncharacterized protein TNCV_1556761 [Trichonephila clavipes]